MLVIQPHRRFTSGASRSCGRSARCRGTAPLRPALRWLGGVALLLACPLVQAQPPGNNRDYFPPDSKPSPPSPVQVIPTRQKAFSIPFTVSQRDQRPVEVQLFVSSDHGRTWRMYARQRPDAGEFAFRATRDGEYWFALWTVFDSKSVPPQNMVAELKVLIDTAPPTLKLETVTGTAGQLAANWYAEDQHLLVESLRVHYQPVVSGGQAPVQWQEVAIDIARDGKPKLRESGKLTWWPRTTAKTIIVRAEVRDTAGNVQVVTRQVTLPNSPTPPDVRQNSRDANSPSVGATGASVPPSTHWPADNTTTALPGDDSGNQLRRSASPQPANENQTQPRPARRKSHSERFASTRNDVEDRVRPVPGRVAAPQPGQRPRMTKSRQFNLRYDVDSVGPEGIESVTLWATRDGGRTWRSWGTDPDNASPFEVNVEEDGVYGFRVVVKGVNGLEGEPPKSGEPADLWVGVDTTKPTGKIVSAPFGTGRETGHLIINWQAADERLATRPINLQFSQSRDGPWTTIAAGLPNNGRYAWLVDPRAPSRIFLRLEVRDEAGNLHVDQPSLPINLSAMIPRGRVRGFEVVEPTR